MASEVFHLTTLTRLLDEDARLIEALGFPEISALDQSDHKCESALRAKAKALLEDPSSSPLLSLYGRQIGPAVELDEIEITLAPPKRLPDWQDPVRLRLDFARWISNDLHHAYVPALGVLVFATRAELVPERVKAHILLILAGRRKQITLRELARIAAWRSVAVGRLEVTAQLKTPRQIAEASEHEEKEPSMLAKMAEELPPFITSRSALPPRTTAPCAFELETELAQLAEALSGPLRRSVLLLGPAGGGKTALVRELARRRHDFALAGTPFWSTSGPRLMTGPIGFGMWQERCQQLCREAATTGAILHLGNLTELLEVGKTNRGQQSVGGFLRPWIARGEITAIAECTSEQLGAIERLEPHLLEVFRQLAVPDRTPAQTRAVLASVLETAPGQPLAREARAHANLALDRLHLLHQRYATYSANPGRSVRFLKNLLADHFPEKVLDESEVVSAFSRETGLPLVLLDDQVPLDLERARHWFDELVVGQPDAVARVLDLLAMTKARLSRPRRPLASLLFIGPTGTGKTEMAKALATFLFGHASRLVRFDLNEFSDPVSVQRLIGGPACGDAEGLLTARVREQPFSVLLLDEFEKADFSFFDLLLQMLGDGRLTDAAGRVADFSNSVIVMTSNLGAQGFQRGPPGFRGDRATTLEIQEHFTSAVQQFLRPEIFNRLDAVVPFHPLAAEIIETIAQRQIDLVWQRDGVRLRRVELRIDPAVTSHLATRGHDERYGARPLKRAIDRELVVPLAEALGAYPLKTPLRAEVRVEAGRLRIDVHVRTEAASESARKAGQARMELVAEIVAKRRRIGRILQGSAVSALENRVTMLTAVERRRARAEKKPSAPDPRLAALPRLRECLEVVSMLADRARGLEDAALTPVYRSEAFDGDLFAAELEALASEFRQSQREVFRLDQPDSDDVVLAFYSEDPQTLFQFAAAYCTVAEEAGKVSAMDVLKAPRSGRTSAARFVRETVEKREKFFAEPPEKVLGIVMHLRGDLFRPRFAGEAGRHEIKEKSTRRVCLIETAEPPISAYEPPEGIERKGGIAARGAALVRSFNREEREVADTRLGESPWLSPGIERVIAALSGDRLNDAIESATA